MRRVAFAGLLGSHAMATPLLQWRNDGYGRRPNPPNAALRAGRDVLSKDEFAKLKRKHMPPKSFVDFEEGTSYFVDNSGWRGSLLWHPHYSEPLSANRPVSPPRRASSSSKPNQMDSKPRGPNCKVVAVSNARANDTAP